MTNIKSLVFFTGRNRDLQCGEGGHGNDGENGDGDADADDGDNDDDDLGTLSPMALSKHFMAAPIAVTS